MIFFVFFLSSTFIIFIIFLFFSFLLFSSFINSTLKNLQKNFLLLLFMCSLIINYIRLIILYYLYLANCTSNHKRAYVVLTPHRYARYAGIYWDVQSSNLGIFIISCSLFIFVRITQNKLRIRNLIGRLITV